MVQSTTMYGTLIDDLDKVSKIITSLKELTGDEHPLAVRIEAGSALWRIAEEAQNAQTQFKDDLRTIALESLAGEGTWSEQGTEEGYAKVVIPKDTLRLKKGINTDALQKCASFAECFEVVMTIKPRKEVGNTIMKLGSSEDREIILDAIETVSSTPRVSLKRR